MANELVIHYPTGATLYVLLFDATGQVWNGSAFAAPGSANWLDYPIAMTEVATSTGVYRASMPAAAAGVYGWVVRKQAGAGPAVTDITVGAGSIRWTGTAEETASDVADAVLVRDWTAISGVVPDRSTLNALRFLRNKWAASGGTLSVYEEDDATVAWEALLTTNSSADRITGSTPE